MANSDTFNVSQRRYCVSLGTVTFGTGTKYQDGTWSTYRKMVVIAEYTETVEVKRAMTAIQTDEPSMVLDTYDFIYGSTTDLKHAYFDYEYSSKTSECHRVNEAGFYERTNITRQCTKIYARQAGNSPEQSS